MAIVVENMNGEKFTSQGGNLVKINEINKTKDTSSVDEKVSTNEDNTPNDTNDVVDDSVNNEENTNENKDDSGNESDEDEAESSEGEDETTNADNDDADSKKKNGFQKRVEKLNKRNEDNVKEIQKLNDSLQAAANEIEVLHGLLTKEPIVSDYETQADYERAVRAYENSIDNYNMEVKKSSKKMEDMLNKKYQKAIDDASERYKKEVFEEAKKNKKIHENNIISIEIFSSDIAGDLMCYLHTHPEELNKILKNKSYREQQKMLHKLEAKIELELEDNGGGVTSKKNDVARKVSKAPKPVNSISSDRVSGEKPLNPNSINSVEEYRKLRASGKI